MHQYIVTSPFWNYYYGFDKNGYLIQEIGSVAPHAGNADRLGIRRRRLKLSLHEEDTDVRKAMDSLDHDLLTGETLDVGDKVTRRLPQEQATLPHPAAKSSGPIQSKQEIAAEAVKKTTNNQLFIVSVTAIVALVVCVILITFHPWTSNQQAQSVQPTQTETVKKEPVKVEVPLASKDAPEYDYEEAQKKFEHAGFTNITTKKDEDLKIGLLNHENQVKEITIDGDKKFSVGEKYNEDAPVVITYHAFPQKSN